MSTAAVEQPKITALAPWFGGKRNISGAIVDHLGGPWKRGTASASGEIKCPVCEDGTLRFTRSGYNGCIHASCSTEDCVRWME